MDASAIEKDADALRVILTGETTLQVVSALRAELAELMRNEKTARIVVDLSGVEFMNTSGINFLVSLNKDAKGMGCTVSLYRPSEQVRKVLDLVQLSRYFTFEDMPGH